MRVPRDSKIAVNTLVDVTNNNIEIYGGTDTIFID